MKLNEIDLYFQIDEVYVKPVVFVRTTILFRPNGILPIKAIREHWIYIIYNHWVVAYINKLSHAIAHA
jgi:hypothetical protein